MLSLKTNLNRILHHKKAIATIWILLILFPNPMVLPVDVYRFFKMPTKPKHYETTQVAFVDNGQFKLPDKTNAFLYLNTYKDIMWTSCAAVFGLTSASCTM